MGVITYYTTLLYSYKNGGKVIISNNCLKSLSCNLFYLFYHIHTHVRKFECYSVAAVGLSRTHWLL